MPLMYAVEIASRTVYLDSRGSFTLPFGRADRKVYATRAAAERAAARIERAGHYIARVTVIL